MFYYMQRHTHNTAKRKNAVWSIGVLQTAKALKLYNDINGLRLYCDYIIFQQGCKQKGFYNVKTCKNANT